MTGEHVTEEQATNHWLTVGLKSGWQASCNFHSSAFLDVHPEIRRQAHNIDEANFLAIKEYICGPWDYQGIYVKSRELAPGCE